jgi:hypothetical protein
MVLESAIYRNLYEYNMCLFGAVRLAASIGGERGSCMPKDNIEQTVLFSMRGRMIIDTPSEGHYLRAQPQIP